MAKSKLSLRGSQATNRSESRNRLLRRSDDRGSAYNDIKKSLKILKAGGVVVYPTDTAYGLAVDATNAKAVKRLYKLKGRNFNKPIHVIVPLGKYFHTLEYGSKWLDRIVRVSLKDQELMKKYWPGALTIVLPLKARGKSWKMLSAGTKTIGIRMPDNKIALDLVNKFGKPITTTSANIAGKLTCYSVSQVKKQFSKSKSKPDYYLSGGRLKKVKPSTVISIINNHAKIIRQGPVKI